jgi:uncharacterized membrane protein
MKTLYVSCIVILGAALSGCQTTERERRGAGVGAATGAVLGGVIGHQSGNAVEGAVIGAAAGGAAGGIYGRQQDRVAHAQSDTYGFAASDYIALMTPEEMDILRARTTSRDAQTMANHLTEEERANLRRRAAQQGTLAE